MAIIGGIPHFQTYPGGNAWVMQLIAAIDVTNMYQEGGLREGHFLLNGKALSLDLPLQDQGVQEPMSLR